MSELRLYTDYGRCSRPLFIVENQRLLIKKSDIRALQVLFLILECFDSHVNISVALSIADTYYIRNRLICDCDVQETNEHGWIDLLKKGFIEYVDTEEEETTMISMTIQVCIRICI